MQQCINQRPNLYANPDPFLPISYFLRDSIIGFVFLVLIVQYSSQKNHVAVFKTVWNESKQDRHLTAYSKQDFFGPIIPCVF